MAVDQIVTQNLGLPDASQRTCEDQRREHQRYDWQVKLQLRVQYPDRPGDPYQQLDVVTRDLCAGGFSYLSKVPLNRNFAVLAYLPHLQQDRCVIGRVRYCQVETGLRYRVGVKFIQRVEMQW
jgi:hypothetical protein